MKASETVGWKSWFNFDPHSTVLPSFMVTVRFELLAGNLNTLNTIDFFKNKLEVDYEVTSVT